MKSCNIVDLTEKMPHCVLVDGLNGDAHIFPMGLIKNLAVGKINITHISDEEQKAIVRCLANGIVDFLGYDK